MPHLMVPFKKKLTAGYRYDCQRKTTVEKFSHTDTEQTGNEHPKESSAKLGHCQVPQCSNRDEHPLHLEEKNREGIR